MGKHDLTIRSTVLLLFLTFVAIIVHGYHPGVEDDFVYLPAIKHDLNPALFPHDADFFRLQLEATVFDKVVAESVKVTHLPLDWVLLAWQTASIFLVLLGCWKIVRRCFAEEPARWSAVALITALLTMPVAGTALFLVDQHLHPRTLATAFVLFAIANVIDRRKFRASLWIAAAAAFHPLMAAFGASFCVFLAWPKRVPARPDVLRESIETPEALPETAEALSVAGEKHSGTAWMLLPFGLLLSAPLGWIFESATPAWKEAAATRDYYFLSRQHWYEWVGTLAPFVVLWAFSRIGRKGSQKNGDKKDALISHISSRLIWYGIFQFEMTLLIMLPPQLVRFRSFQPLRYLHLLYFLMMLMAGGLIGRYVLRTKAWRWALLFVPLALGMFLSQRYEFPASRHIELPRESLSNAWLQAFSWVRQNTPTDAYFALGPYYMIAPGEDWHSFRAIAERSQLGDGLKDPSVSTQVPRLAARWQRECHAQDGWDNFQKADFERLKTSFGVGWVVLNRAVDGLDCPFTTGGEGAIRVCRII